MTRIADGYPLCVDCRFVRIRRRWFIGPRTMPKCAHPFNYSLFAYDQGEDIPFCFFARVVHVCGLDATLFEAKS